MFGLFFLPASGDGFEFMNQVVAAFWMRHVCIVDIGTLWQNFSRATRVWVDLHYTQAD